MPAGELPGRDGGSIVGDSIRRHDVQAVPGLPDPIHDVERQNLDAPGLFGQREIRSIEAQLCPAVEAVPRLPCNDGRPSGSRDLLTDDLPVDGEVDESGDEAGVFRLGEVDACGLEERRREDVGGNGRGAEDIARTRIVDRIHLVEIDRAWEHALEQLAPGLHRDGVVDQRAAPHAGAHGNADPVADHALEDACKHVEPCRWQAEPLLDDCDGRERTEPGGAPVGPLEGGEGVAIGPDGPPSSTFQDDGVHACVGQPQRRDRAAVPAAMTTAGTKSGSFVEP
jgi:hypothetical protein